MGDAALRAGQPRRRRPWAGGSGCCGSWAARRRAARRRRSGLVVAPVKALLQRLGPSRTAARPVVVAEGRPDRRGRAGGRAGGHGLPARVPGRAPRRAGRAGRDRRRLPLHRRRAGAHRPVGRRGRPADRGSTSATSARSTTSAPSSCSAAASWSPTRPCGSGPPRLVGTAAVGPPPVGAAGRRRPVRRHGVVAALAGRRRGARLPTCWAATPWSSWSSPAGSGTGPASCSTRRRPWPTPWPPPGALEQGDGRSPGCTSPSTGC